VTLNSALVIFLFALTIAGVTHTNNQQVQQSCVNAAICLLAVRSGSSPRRRSDLQVHGPGRPAALNRVERHHQFLVERAIRTLPL
jgi:hypothetical protein